MSTEKWIEFHFNPFFAVPIRLDVQRMVYSRNEMIKIPKEYENESMVVYLIRNNINGKLYVGITTRKLKKRMKEHRDVSLRSPSDTSILLYSALKKYGSENFSVSVLEKCKSRKDLELSEEKWIKLMNSLSNEFGYNILKGSKPLWCQTPTGGIKDSHKDTLRKRMNKLKDKYIEMNQKDWVVVDPSGKIQEITNLNKFCNENDLDSANMVKLTTFRKNSFHKGWQCFKKEEFSEDKVKKFTNGYRITKDDGTFEEFKGSLIKYTVTRDLDNSNLHKLRKGRIQKYKDVVKVEDIYIPQSSLSSSASNSSGNSANNSC